MIQINETPIKIFNAFSSLSNDMYIKNFDMLIVESGAGYDCVVSSTYENIIKGIGDALDKTAESFDFLGLYSTCKNVFNTVNSSVEKTAEDLSQCVTNATEGLKRASQAFPEVGEDISLLIQKASDNVYKIASDLMDTVEEVVSNADEMAADAANLLRDINDFLINIPQDINNGLKNTHNLLLILGSVACCVIALMILMYFLNKGGKHGAN